jgi:hypothetical protein
MLILETFVSLFLPDSSINKGEIILPEKKGIGFLVVIFEVLIGAFIETAGGRAKSLYSWHAVSKDGILGKVPNA